MNKILKIVGIVLAVVLILMIALPILFKGKIKDAVIKAANENLNATVAIEDFGLNLFSNFPNATLSLDNMSVVGQGDFVGDTLVAARNASVTIDLASLFGDNYKISKINLEDASVLAIVLADGRANWDIMKESEESEVAADADASPFNLNLQQIKIKNANIVYDDREGTGMKAMLVGWNGTVSGDFNASETTIKTQSVIDQITFAMGGVPYINKVKGVANATVKADMDNMKFAFEKSELRLNELEASIDGTFGFVGEEGMEFDLKLNAPDTQFKDILSIVPAMYTSEFKDLKTAGTASLDATIKGVMEGESYPSFDVKMHIADAMFQYPSLPQAVSHINVLATVNNPGGSLDNTLVNVSQFTFTMAGNPFAISAKVATPMSDANITAHANGTIDLGMIKNVYPLEKGTELNGKITANLELAARMSTMEKEQYEQVQAKGMLTLANMIYKAEGAQDVTIKEAGLEFTPRYVMLSKLAIQIGKNDISAHGRLENFIAYALKNKTLKGQLTINSNYLNLNDFITEETTGVEADSAAETPSEDIVIPKNINFGLNVNMKQIVYGKIDITNMQGAMTVKDGILNMSNVGANLLGGTAKVTGAYDTSNPKKAKVNFALNLANVSFAETFKSVEAIQKLAPIFENMEGNYSMGFNFNTAFGATMDETLKALSGAGSLKTSNLKLENIKALSALSDALKTDALKTITAKDVNIGFEVKDGRIATSPFTLNIGQGGAMKLEGTTGLDQTIDYKGTVTLPKSLSNSYINNVPVTIKGSFASPKIGVDAKALAGEAISNVLGGILGGKDKDGEKSKVGEVASALTDKTAQAAKIRQTAQESSDKLVKAAEEQAEALVEKAGDKKLAQAGAKVAGKKLVDEAKKQGAKLVEKAEEEAKKLETAE